VSGEIAEDFAAYFASSEQVPTACAFGVLVDRDRTVLAAGGYIIQRMPGAPDSVIDSVEKNVAATGAVTDVLNRGGAEALLSSVMAGFSPRVIERLSVEYRCTCSRERFRNAILSLDKAELEDMRMTGEPVEVSCRFCEAVQVYDISELAENT